MIGTHFLFPARHPLRPRKNPAFSFNCILNTTDPRTTGSTRTRTLDGNDLQDITSFFVILCGGSRGVTSSLFKKIGSKAVIRPYDGLLCAKSHHITRRPSCAQKQRFLMISQDFITRTKIFPYDITSWSHLNKCKLKSHSSLRTMNTTAASVASW